MLCLYSVAMIKDTVTNNNIRKSDFQSNRKFVIVGKAQDGGRHRKLRYHISMAFKGRKREKK